jgi:peptide deformylase
MIRQEDGTLVDLVNPYILRMYGAEYRHFETCISCPPPDNNCKVDRMQIIEVMAGTVENPGLEREWRFKGIDSRVVQHEIDHLSGTFFFDRANLNDRAKVIERFQQWKLKDKGESNGNGNSTKTQAVHSRAFTT